jgi:hypothetical protein
VVAGFVVGADVVGADVVGAVVGEVVGLLVGELVGVAVADVVGVGVQVGEDVGLLVAVAEGWVAGALPPDWEVGVSVGLAGVFEALVVAVGVAGGFVVSPARDAVGLTFGEPCEPDSSRTATTAMMTAAAAAVIGQRHRRQPDVRLAGGMPPVPPGMPPVPPGRGGVARLNGPDAGTSDVASIPGVPGPRLRSTRVAEAPPTAADAPMTGSSVVGS